MSKKWLMFYTIAIVLITGLFLSDAPIMAQSEKPVMAPICKQCHTPGEKTLFGTLGGVSGKAMTIQLNAGPAVWLLKFDENTKLKGAESFGKIKKEHEISIAYAEKDGTLLALNVAVKPPAKLSDEKMIKTDALAKLIAEKADMVVVDSRPGARYHEGHVPGSISIYDADFDKNAEKLPKEKDTLLIFYCGGVT